MFGKTEHVINFKEADAHGTRLSPESTIVDMNPVEMVSCSWVVIGKPNLIFGANRRKKLYDN